MITANHHISDQLLTDIHGFLSCMTEEPWLQAALKHYDILLIDQAHCEKKAASTALSLIHRYPQYTGLLQKMSRLAREELRHFEKVLTCMQQRNIVFCYLSASRYAVALRAHIRHEEPARLIDTLIVGAFIEARSCERFAKLAPHLDTQLSAFYQSLLKSEARHFRDYLHLASSIADGPIDDRIAVFAGIEAELITAPDTQFRFHSGNPMVTSIKI